MPKKEKLYTMLALCIAGFISIFLVALAISNDFRDSVGMLALIIGCDLINPIPTLDWAYFVFPVAILLYYITGDWMTPSRAVLVAYALSHVAGVILILIGILLIGGSAKSTVSKYLHWMITDPLFIMVMIVSIVLIISVLYFDFKLKKDKNKR